MLEDKLRAATRYAATAAQQDELLEALRAFRAGDQKFLLKTLATMRLCAPVELATAGPA